MYELMRVAGGVVGARRFYRRPPGAGAAWGRGHYCAAAGHWCGGMACSEATAHVEPVGLAEAGRPWLVAMAPKTGAAACDTRLGASAGMIIGTSLQQTASSPSVALASCFIWPSPNGVVVPEISIYPVLVVCLHAAASSSGKGNKLVTSWQKLADGCLKGYWLRTR
jgi:hypothetical protein